MHLGKYYTMSPQHLIIQSPVGFDLPLNQLPKIGDLVSNERHDPIGRIADVFGPTSRPFFSVKLLQELPEGKARKPLPSTMNKAVVAKTEDLAIPTNPYTINDSFYLSAPTFKSTIKFSGKRASNEGSRPAHRRIASKGGTPKPTGDASPKPQKKGVPGPQGKPHPSTPHPTGNRPKANTNANPKQNRPHSRQPR